MKPPPVKKVLITRPAVFCEDFADKVKKAGFEPVILPMIQTETILPDESDSSELRQLNTYDWIIFASRLAVFHFFKQLSDFELTLSRDVKLACIGNITQAELTKHGFEADFVPSVFSAKEFSDSFEKESSRILIPSSNIAPDFIRKKLSEKGHQVNRIKIYKTIPVNYSHQDLTNVLGQGVDFITFTSNSTVDSFFDENNAKDYLSGDEKFIGIGPPTVYSLQQRKLKSIFKAKPHNVEGIIKTIENLTIQMK